MVVPQGEARRELDWCFFRVVDFVTDVIGKQPVIGISKGIEKFPGGRYRFLSEVVGPYHDLHPEVVVHLLGFTTIQSVTNIARDFPWIRSMDTAKAIVTALQRVEIPDRPLPLSADEEAKLPHRDDKTFFDAELDDEQVAIALKNINTIRKAVGDVWPASIRST
jgi:hypothetical protein